MKKVYYEINEELAKRAKEYNSFSDYIENSETKFYQEQIDAVYEVALKKMEELPKGLHYRIETMFIRYSKALADFINKKNSIDCRVPSVLIVGGGNFNNKAKEKQNIARSKNYAHYEKIKELFEQMRDFSEREIRKELKYEIEFTGFKNDDMEIIVNNDINRLQIDFKEKPDEELRAKLKKNAFKWAPSKKVWQRQLTPNAIRATKIIFEIN